MSDRKVIDGTDPLARLASIETPEFLDRLVLERARALLLEQGALAKQASRPSRARGLRTLKRAPKRTLAGVAAWFGRLAPPSPRSS